MALLGTGVVGGAVWARLASWSGTPLGERLSLVHAANSRFAISNRDGIPADTREVLMRNPPHASSLDARLRVHQENTEALVGLLDGHPAVGALYYPGLASHPGHALAARQQHGFGAMLSLELAGGEAAVRAFVDGLQYFTLAESLGGVESLVAHPATMTHAAMTPEARARAGIPDGLLRLSVGIEWGEDLQADIADALARAEAATAAAGASVAGAAAAGGEA